MVHVKIAKALRNNILVGLILVTPIVVTLFIANWMFRFFLDNPLLRVLNKTLVKTLPPSLADSHYEQLMLKIFTVIFVLIMLFLIGFFVRSFIGRRLYQIGDKLITNIPVVNRIYIYVRQISEAFLTHRQTVFKEVVLVEYPRKGLHSIAFITSEIPESFEEHLDPGHGMSKHVSLFIPTTPNPTSGLMIITPQADVTPLKITVAEAMKMIVSAGAVHPGAGIEDERPTLLDKLENWMARESKS